MQKKNFMDRIKDLGFASKEIGLVLATTVGGVAMIPLLSFIDSKKFPSWDSLIVSIGLLLLCYFGTRWYSFFEQNTPLGTTPQMIKTFLVRAIIILAAGIFLIGVSFNNSLSETRTDEIKVGVIGPFTGDVASYGELVRNAAELACDEVNGNKAVSKKKLKLIFEDTQCKPENAVSAIKKLIAIDKVQVILGDTCSSATYAAGNIAQNNKVVLLTPISSADNISRIGDYVFRLAPYDSFQAEIVAEWIRSSGYKKVAILHINNDYGVGLANAFKENFENFGGTVVIVQSIEQGETNIRAQWQNIKTSAAEVVFAPAYPVEAINILIQKKELGINIPLYGTDPYHDPKVLQIAKEAAEGVLFTDVAEGSGETWNEFVAKYEEKYGSKPNVVAAESYDTVKIINHVLNTYGTTAEDIKRGLSELKGYIGVTGLVEFDENGDCVTKTFNKFKIENNSYVNIQ